MRRLPLRRTRVTALLRFVPSGQPLPRAPPPRPGATGSGDNPLPAGLCLTLPAPVPEDHLVSSSPLTVVDDYDEERAWQDRVRAHRQAMRRWAKEGRGADHEKPRGG